MAGYSKLPSTVKVQPTPFKAQVDDQKLQDLKALLKLSPIGRPTYENTNNGRKYGMTREYLAKAKHVWENEFDWRKWEDSINSYPNYTMPVEHDGVKLDIHFIALFSQKPGAIPLALYHGWPGSVLEFLQILDVLKKKYDPNALPYHVIVPSLPGYAYSSGPPVDRDYNTVDASAHLDVLMQNLGFSSGYIAQGGDIGSFVARWQAAHCDGCVGAHLNMIAGPPDQGEDESSLSEAQKQGLESTAAFRKSGMSYFTEHGTRTSTIGLALDASPLALLSWIGEKFLEWSDEDPPVEEILASVTLYWLTETFGRCIYPYRALGSNESGRSPKPIGYSLFPYDIVVATKEWVNKSFNVVTYKEHPSGGHFAAMEKPNELLADIDEFVAKAWNSPKL